MACDHFVGRSMKQSSRREIRASTIEVLAVALFLIGWTVLEAVTGAGPNSHAPPGTTFHAANKAGATVTPSEQPSALEDQPIAPAPSPRQ
jgi:hypothetical protein